MTRSSLESSTTLGKPRNFRRVRHAAARMAALRSFRQDALTSAATKNERFMVPLRDFEGVEALDEPADEPPGFGLRQPARDTDFVACPRKRSSSALLSAVQEWKSGAEAPQSKRWRAESMLLGVHGRTSFLMTRQLRADTAFWYECSRRSAGCLVRIFHNGCV